MLPVIMKLNLLISLPIFVSSIRISDIHVPRYHLSGEDLNLNCSYRHDETKVDPLYSIKWYRGLDHFYEFVPGRKPEVKAFPFNGLNVDLNGSRGSSVTLTDVNRNTSGIFRCEVMGDKPYFETDSYSSNLTVIEAPIQGPKIRGAEHNSQVRVGDHITIHCSVGESNPPANLTWILNGRSSGITRNPLRKSDAWGRQVIETSLDVYLTSTSFVKGALHIECLAEVHNVYRKSQRLVLLDVDRPKPAGIGWWFSSGSRAAAPGILVVVTTLASERWSAH